MHLIAAAEITPSGVPPIPHSRSTGEFSLDGQQRGGHVAVGDQAHARAGVADLLHGVLVALAVEHHHHHVADVAVLALGDELERLGQRAVEIEQVGDVGAAGDLLHVDARPRIEHRPALGQRDHGQRVGHAERGQPGALQRIDGDVDLGRDAVADLLAVEEHRRLVLLALADHHHAVHRDGVQHRAHRVHGGLVGSLLVAAADLAGGGQRGRLGHADELEREVAIGLVGWCSQDSRGLAARAAHLGAPDGAEQDQQVADQRQPPADRDADLAGRRARLVDRRPGTGSATSATQRDDGGQLAARPGQRVAADDDVGEDRGGDGGDQQHVADGAQRGPAGAVVVGPRQVPSDAWRLPSVYQLRNSEIPSRMPPTMASSSPRVRSRKRIAPEPNRFRHTASRHGVRPPVTRRPDSVDRSSEHMPELGSRRAALRPSAPFTVANFVSSLDGRASVQGRSGGLGDDGDKAMFRALRRASDAVLVGTGTMADRALRADRRRPGRPGGAARTAAWTPSRSP